MPPPRRRPRLQDVAERVGVSAKTVSNAYRATGQLTPALRERILEAAAELGYPGPDPVASALRRGRVGAVGVVYANRLAYAFDDPTTSALLTGFSGGVQEAGLGILLLPGSADPERRTAAVGDAVLDGILASSLAEDDPLLRTVIERRVPSVVVDQPRPDALAQLGGEGIPWVGIDDTEAARRLGDHVLDLGHRRLGVVSFGLRHRTPEGLASVRDQERATLAVTRDRLAGYRTAVERRGLDWSAVPVAAGPDSTVAAGRARAHALLAIDPRPTALLCLSDRLAEGAVAAAADLGLRVPEDLSIAGFDDAPRLAAELGLTTVRQPSHAKGRHAAEALLALLAGAEPERVTLLGTELVVRSSTGLAPGG